MTQKYQLILYSKDCKWTRNTWKRWKLRSGFPLKNVKYPFDKSWCQEMSWPWFQSYLDPKNHFSQYSGPKIGHLPPPPLMYMCWVQALNVNMCTQASRHCVRGEVKGKLSNETCWCTFVTWFLLVCGEVPFWQESRLKVSSVRKRDCRYLVAK